MIDRTNVLGVGISAVSLTTASDQIARWISEKAPQKNESARYVCVTGVHGVIESQLDPQLRSIHNAADLVTPDGMPLVWLSWLHGKRHVTRVYGPDLMLELCRRGEAEGWRHYFYGTTEATLTTLVGRLASTFPALQMAGMYSPPFRELKSDEASEIARAINRSGADIVWVGLSTPKQERWMASFRSRLTVPVLIGVGAAFDFHAGKVRQAPRWIQGVGMEWCFRLCAEPRRLWSRYLRNNPMFILLVVAQLLRLKRWPISSEL